MNAPLTPEMVVNSDTAGNQFEAQVATLRDGTFYVVWTSRGQDGDGDGIYAQRMASGGERLGGPIPVNTKTTGDQTDPSIAAMENGGFVVVWEGTSQDVSSSQALGVIGQRFSADGAKLGGEFIVNTVNTFDSQFDPHVSALPGGGFAVAFTDDRGDGQSDGIRLRLYDENGAPRGADFQVNGRTSGAQTEPAVAAIQPGSDGNDLQSGGVVVVWTGSDGGNVGVFGQVYEANGMPVGAEFLVNTITTNSQFDASVAGLSGGRFVVTWEDNTNDGSSGGIFAQLYEGNGTPVGGQFLVNVETASTQDNPDVTATDDGGFVVSWTSATSGTAGDGSFTGIFARRFDSNGAATSDEFQVNEIALSNQNLSDLAPLDGGDFVSVWQSGNLGPAGDGDGLGVFQRIFGDPDETVSNVDPVLGGIGRAVSFIEDDLNDGQLLIDADGGARVLDPDSANFDGGTIIVSTVGAAPDLIEQMNAPDDLTQDQLGLKQDARVAISGTAVSVDGRVVAQIVQDGQKGAPFEMSLNGNATTGIVELLVNGLTYSNISDDPLEARTLSVAITDGNGGRSDPQLVTVTITPSRDAEKFAGGEEVVNSSGWLSKDNAAIATLPGTGGDFVVVWQSFTMEGREDIYAQRFDAAGNKLARDGSALAADGADEFRVNMTTARNQVDAQIDVFSTGGFVVTWSDDGYNDGSGQGVFARIFASDGSAGAEFTVDALVTSTQNKAEVAVLDDDTFVVAWGSTDHAGPGTDAGIVARHFASDGTPLGSKFVVNSQTLNSQRDLDITVLDDGGFLIARQGKSNDSSAEAGEDGIFAQRFDSAANPVGPEFRVNSSTSGDQAEQQVTLLTSGDLLFAWTENATDGSDLGVYAAVYAPDGTTLSDAFRVNDQRIGAQSEPAIAALDTGGFVIAWRDDNGTDGSGSGVFAQQYDADGGRLDSQVQVNTTTLGNQSRPDVTALPGGGFAVTYDGANIWVQTFGNGALTVSPVSATGSEDTPIVLDAAIFDGGFSDPEGNALREILIETLPANGQLALSGTSLIAGQIVDRLDLMAGNLTYTGDADYSGSDSFLWTGSNGSVFASGGAVMAGIDVAPVNDAPGLEAGSNAEIAAGAVFSRSVTLSDPDGDSREFTVDFGDGTPPQTFTTTALSPQIQTTFTEAGTYTVTVSVDDRAGAANSIETDAFTVTVGTTDPIGVSDFAVVGEDGPGVIGNVLSNDIATGNALLSVGLVNGLSSSVGTPLSLPSGAILRIASDGSFEYDPNGQFESLTASQSFEEQVTYQVTDGMGGVETATLFLTVEGRNDAPEGRDDSFAVNEDGIVSGNVLADNGAGADRDIDAADTLSVLALDGAPGALGAATELASGALVTMRADGTFDYDQNGAYADLAAGLSTTDSFTYTVTDGRSGFDAATVTLRIDGANKAPDAVDDTAGTNENAAIVIGNVLANDSDPNDDPLSIAGVNTQGTLGRVTDNGDGTFGYDPNGAFGTLSPGESATDTFRYSISDGNGGRDTASVTIVIEGMPEVVGRNVVQGTVASERLGGTDGADEIRSGGGSFDVLTGGLGPDTFVFEEGAGISRNKLNITDYTSGEDIVDLDGNSLRFSFSFGNTTYLYIDNLGFDLVILNGVGSVADIDFA